MFVLFLYQNKGIYNYTNDELEILKGIHSIVGRKYEKSGTYVSLIVKGERQANTLVAKSILRDLKAILDILTSGVNEINPPEGD